MITKTNFFTSTFALFKACKTPRRKADYISYSSEYHGGGISSKYWYGKDKKGEYIIRSSNHWVSRKNYKLNKLSTDCKMISSCNWQIINPKTKNYENKNKKSVITGKCYLARFKRI